MTTTRRWPAVGALVASALLATGALVGLRDSRAEPVDRGTVPPSGTSATSAAAAANGTAAPAAAARPTAPPRGRQPFRLTTLAVPARVSLPTLRIDAPVTPVGVDSSGLLGIPDDPQVVGWWAGGAAPGDRRGTTVLVGHVDTAKDGPGAFFRLRELRLGARVVVTTRSGRRPYAVRAVKTYRKQRLPAASVFDATGSPRLVLVTCTGPFDESTRHYRDNLVVYATPV